MKRLVVAILCLGGCARQAPLHPLDTAAVARSSPRTVIVALSEPPPFHMTAAPQFVPIPGPSFVASATKFALKMQDMSRAKAIFDTGFGDPAATARPFLVTALAQRFAVREINRGMTVTSANAPADVARDYAGVDLIVDVRTLKWGLIATRENRLWLQYEARLRLIDGRNGSVLAEGNCANPEPRSDTEQPPVYLAWAFDNGAKLKQELWATANRCVGEYLTRVLRI